MYFVTTVTILVPFSSQLEMNFGLKLTMTLIILSVFGNAIKKFKQSSTTKTEMFVFPYLFINIQWAY